MSLITDPIDLALGADNDLIMPLRFTRGVAAVVQGVRIRLRMIRGEWFLDLTAGLPWLANAQVPRAEALLGGKFNKDRATAEIRKAIEAAPNVAAVTAIDVTFDHNTRLMTVKWEARTSFGDSASDTLALPVALIGV